MTVAACHRSLCRLFWNLDLGKPKLDAMNILGVSFKMQNTLQWHPLLSACWMGAGDRRVRCEAAEVLVFDMIHHLRHPAVTEHPLGEGQASIAYAE